MDDNYGYVRRFPDERERRRTGGGGVYYHLSYLGVPHPYLWLESNPPARTLREMTRAHERGVRESWIVNVGDLKRREWGTEFFLRLGWDVDTWSPETVEQYFERVARRDISPTYADRIAELLGEYYTLATQRRPEFMGFSFHWFGLDDVDDPDFSLWNYGDEVQTRIDRYRDLRERADELSEQISEENEDAFFQLVYYPIAGAARLNEKLLYAYKSRAYAERGRAEANRYADLAEEAHEACLELTRQYNEEIADGKWDGIVNHRPGPEGGSEVFGPPSVDRVNLPTYGGIDVTIEGTSVPLSELDGDGKRVERNQITLSAGDATTDGHIILDRDQKGTHLRVREKDENEGDETGLPSNVASFEFTVDEESSGPFELYAELDNHDESEWEWESEPWYIQFDDDPQPIEWNSDVGVGKFKIGEYGLDSGRHTVRFCTRQVGAKLRQVELVSKETNVLPEFNRYTRTRRFFDVSCRADSTQEWSADVSDPWIELSTETGEVGDEAERVWVDVAYERLPEDDDPMGYIDVTDGERTYRVFVTVYNQDLELDAGSHIEDNGVIAIDADSYRNRRSGARADWVEFDGLGRTGTAMSLDPLTGWYIEDVDAVPDVCPSLEYQVFVTSGGKTRLRIDAVPSFPLDCEAELRTAISVDDRDPEWVTFKMGPAESRNWKHNVAENTVAGTIELDLEPGMHTLTVWGTDPSINIFELTLDFGGLRESYLGPRETVVKNGH